MTTYKSIKYNISGADLTGIPTSAITSGTFADARISSGSVTQHVTATDLQPIKSDITALALREATNEASAAFNLPNQFIETFATDTLGTKTDVSISGGAAITISSTPATEVLLHFEETSSNYTNDGIGQQAGQTLTLPTIVNNTNEKFGTYAHKVDQSTGRSVKLTGTDLITSSSDFTVEWFQNNNGLPSGQQEYTAYSEIQTSTGGGTDLQILQLRANFGAENSYIYYPATSTAVGTSNDTSWRHYAYSRQNGTTAMWFDGTRVFSISDTQVYDGVSIGNYVTNETSYRFIQLIDDVLICTTVGKYNPSSSSITVPTSTLTAINVGTDSATGTAIQAANAVGSAKTKVGGTMLYKDNEGTATLGTDLIIYFTCNGGTNWTEAASYNAVTPVYSTGVKQVRLGETTCTSGTDIRYKAVWANQAVDSKETQLHGIGINY